MRLSDVRIKNFRSIEDVTLHLGDTTTLFGKNDSGKSNILKALEFALTRGYLDEEDFRLTTATANQREQIITVDVLFVITEDVNGEKTQEYEDLSLFLSEDVVSEDDRGRGIIAFRAKAYYDSDKGQFEKRHSIINDWRYPEIEGNALPAETFDVIDFVLLDAHRDIAEVIRNRSSRWNKELAHTDIAHEQSEPIEQALASLGKQIVSKSAFLKRAEQDLRAATERLSGDVEISPIARNLSELYRGLDIFVQEDGNVKLPISVSGSGTRSRAVFMVYKSLINMQREVSRERKQPYFCIVAMEEPEAHVHPQSQQQLLKTFASIGDQRLVTTHSPYVLSVTPIDDLRHVRRIAGKTECIDLSKLKLTEAQKAEISRYVLRSRGDLLFADAVIMGEGETEEQAIPVFFESRFGCDPFSKGVAVLGVGGINYRYFILFLSRLGVKWFILSDGEADALGKLRRTLQDVFSLGKKPDLANCPNIAIWDGNNDFEEALISLGYAGEMIAAVDKHMGGNGDGTEFERRKQEEDGTPAKPEKTGQKCPTCGKSLFVDAKYDYSAPDGDVAYLTNLLNRKGKAKYARGIAQEIVSNTQGKPRIPKTINCLFNGVEKALEEVTP